MLIDTPGFLNGDKADAKSVDNMILRLSEIDYVNSIFIVMNGQQPRINKNVKDMLLKFYKIFGD